MKVRDADYDIREYFYKVRDQYPNLTLKDFEKICKSPFTYFRKQIESNNFPVILIKYLGKLIPFRDFRKKQNEEAKIACQEQPQSQRHLPVSYRQLPVLAVVPQEPQTEDSINPATHQRTDNSEDKGVDGQ